MQAGDSFDCNQVIAEITSALHHKSASVLSADTHQHLSACSRCRVGLLLLVRAFDSEPHPGATHQSCERCQADLAAFIDLEPEDPVEAATIYPHVWWHLWTCEMCGQTYEFTHTLLDAQRSGRLSPLQLPRPDPSTMVPIVRQVRLNRQFLESALPNRMLTTAALRGSDDRYVLFDETEDEPESRQFTIIAEEEGDGLWKVVVTVKPPPAGLLVLTIGTFRLVAPFNTEGMATIWDISSDVLLAPNGPEIEMGVVSLNYLDG